MERNRRSHRVEWMAKVLGVSRSGYYAWRRPPACERARDEQQLVREITTIQEQVKYRYGSPRVREGLKRRGFGVGKNRVARLMREYRLGRRLKKRYRSTTDSKHGHAVAENLVQREFDVAAANRIWASDLSYVATAEGWMYVCVVLDLYSRKIIGWAMGNRMRANLMIQALLMACVHRNPPAGLIFHSDRGSQYCSAAFRTYLRLYRIRQSMSRAGDPWDTAMSGIVF